MDSKEMQSSSKCLLHQEELQENLILCPSLIDSSWCVINNDKLLQCKKKFIGKLHMSWVCNIFRNAFHTIKRWFEHMGETLMQVLDAHIPSPGPQISNTSELCDNYSMFRANKKE